MPSMGICIATAAGVAHSHREVLEDDFRGGGISRFHLALVLEL